MSKIKKSKYCDICITNPVCDEKYDLIGDCKILRMASNLETLLKYINDDELFPLFTIEGGCTILQKESCDDTEYSKKYKKILLENRDMLDEVINIHFSKENK